VASDMDPKLADRIVQILVNMKNTEKGRQVLKQIGFPGYRAVQSPVEYEPVRPYMEQAITELSRLHKQTPN
jgi:ABC-type phosphate/phosphonate transport system substrate-binding protein